MQEALAGIGFDNRRRRKTLFGANTSPDIMTFSFPTLFAALRSLSGVSRYIYWGNCSRCERSTPWETNALRGEYRCMECGHPHE